MILILGSSVIIVLCIIFFVIHLNLDKKVVYKDLKGKHVVVTGGSSGIGKAAAAEAVRLGAHVTIIGRDVQKLSSAIQELTALRAESDQKIQYSALDVTSDYQTIEKHLSALESEVGPIFMLIACAGQCICGQFETMKHEEIKQMIDLNYFGTAYPTRYVLPGMKERNEGLIVFVSTEAALIGIYGYSAYGAAKWAVRGLAESVLMELVGTNVRLTLAFPADTDTPGFANEELTKPKETKLISGSGGLQSPEDVGKKMIWDALVSNINKKLTLAFPADTETPGFTNEELTKPKDTKLISGSEGLQSPEDVGKKMIWDALNGKTYSVYGASGTMLSTLFCGSIESIQQVVLQVLFMGIIRTITVGILLSFHKIVRDGVRDRKRCEIKKAN